MAQTAKYCVDGGAGVADGSSWADAWSFQTALTSCTAGDTLHMEGGTYTMASNPTWSFTAAPTSQLPFIVIGYKADHSEPMQDWDDCPVIDCVSSYGGFDFGTAYDCFGVYGIKIIDGTGTGFRADNYSSWVRCWVDGFGGTGFDPDDQARFIMCRASNNGYDGFYGGTGAFFLGCESINNGRDGFEGSNYAAFAFCYSSGHDGGSFYYGINSGTIGGAVAFSTTEDCRTGIGSTTGLQTYFGNIVTNNTTGMKLGASYPTLFDIETVMFGNTTDYVVLTEHIHQHTTDPDYVAISTDDYDIQESSYIDAIENGAMEFNLGASQSRPAGGGGGGGGAGPIIRGRIINS